MTSPNHNKKWLFWLVGFVLSLYFIYLIRGILLPFVVGMLTAYFLDPAADRLEKKGFSRNSSTLIIAGCFFAVIAVVCITLPPLIIDQFSGLIGALPDTIASLSAKYNDLLARTTGMLPEADMAGFNETAASAVARAFGLLGDLIGGLFASGAVLLNLLALILITPVVTFYMLRDWDNIVDRLDALLPRSQADTIRTQLTRIDDTLAGFVRGQINVCLILGAFYAIALTLAGLNFGLIIGILTGFLIIVPYAGSIFSFLLTMGVAAFQFDSLNDIALIAIIYGIGQVLEGYVLVPKLVGEKVGLHPVWVIFGMLAGGALFGFVGVLLAVPGAAVIGVLIRFATERYLQSHYYQ